MKQLTILLFFATISFPLFAQDNKTISGVVSSQGSGEPLIGVNVTVPGTTKGVVTGANGQFSIELEPNDTLLQFSFIGFLTELVNIRNKTKVDMFLTENLQNLEEIIVVGYGTQRKSDLTGAVSVVDMNEFNKRSVGSVEQALQGQVAGVEVISNSGSPGGGTMVRIRGIGTINNASPLFIVDGMLVDNIDFVNPNDIESVQVLKDASSSAIYGSRGANGVIILTTKKGGDKGAIKLDSYYGVQNFWRSTNVMDATNWACLKNEAMLAAGNPAAIADPGSLETTDWSDEISKQNASISSLNFSASGGNDKGNHFFSINNFNQEGIIKKTSYNRTTFRANTSYKIKPWLKIGENVTVAKEKYQKGVEADEWTSMIITAIAKDPASPVRNSDGSFAPGIYNDTWNPAAIIEYTNNNDLIYRTIGNVYADFTIIRGLTLRTNYAVEYSFGETDTYEPVYFVSSVQQNSISNLTKNHSNRLTRQWSNTLTYDKSFGYHKITTLIGAETYSYDYKYSWIGVNDLISDDPDIRYIDNASGKNQASVSGSISQERQLSALARINYSFMDKYLLTTNFRADASSKFTRKNQWGYFPSFSAGWKLSEEDFFNTISFINQLKLRAGWGQIGNQGSVPPYQDVTIAYSGSNYLWGGALASGMYFPGSGNDEIKWETTTTTNIGLDFGLFKGMLSGTLEYYIKNTSDMLLQVPVPGQTGIGSPPYQNACEMKNSGLEVSVLYQNREHRFKYSLGANFSTVKNEIISLGPENDAYIDGASFMNSYYVTRTVVGKPIAQFYGRKTDGLFQNQAGIDAQTAQQNVAPGDVKYVDADNDGENEYYFLGSPLPDFTYSFNANFKYTGFDLSIVFQGVYGNEIFNGTSFYTRSSTATWNLSREMMNRWTGEGTQNNARYPRMNANDVNNSLMSDRFIEDGSYLRIKTLQLGYTISRAISDRLQLEKLRIYINAQNLFTFTDYKGLDPEIGMRNDSPLDVGVDRGFYPQPRMYTMGINLVF